MKTIHIEICKSEYAEGKYRIRIGDIQGSSDTGNITRDELMSEIQDAIEKVAYEQQDEPGNNYKRGFNAGVEVMKLQLKKELFG